MLYLLKWRVITKTLTFILRQVGELKWLCSDRCQLEGTLEHIEPLDYLLVCERLHLSAKVLHRDFGSVLEAKGKVKLLPPSKYNRI